MLNFVNKFFGTKSEKDVKKLLPIVTEVHKAEKELIELSNGKDKYK